MRTSSLVLSLVLGCSCAALSGCGGGAQAVPPAAPTPADAPASSAEPAASAPSSVTADAPQPPAGDAADASAETAKPAKEKADDPNATREITYSVVPEGLKVSVSGVKFTVSAAAAQVGPGWGVKVSVVASAEDGKPHSLSNPKAGPMAFAGSVKRKGKSEPEAFGDQRGGDGE